MLAYLTHFMDEKVVLVKFFPWTIGLAKIFYWVVFALLSQNPIITCLI